MSRWADIATVIASVLVTVGVLVGGVHWTVSGAVDPLRADLRDFRAEVRSDIGGLRDDVHALDVRVARLEEGQQIIVRRLERVEAGQEAIESRLHRVEAGQGAIEERLDRIEALKVAQRP